MTTKQHKPRRITHGPWHRRRVAKKFDALVQARSQRLQNALRLHGPEKPDGFFVHRCGVTLDEVRAARDAAASESEMQPANPLRACEGITQETEQ